MSFLSSFLSSFFSALAGEGLPAPDPLEEPGGVGAPGVDFVAANEAAHCRFMKMITLPKLRDALRDGRPEVKVDPALAARARTPIERMVAIA